MRMMTMLLLCTICLTCAMLGLALRISLRLFRLAFLAALAVGAAVFTCLLAVPVLAMVPASVCLFLLAYAPSCGKQ